MKAFLIALTFFFSASTFAANLGESRSCRRYAITAARSSTFSADRLYDFEETVANKTYLLSYVVTFADSIYEPRKIEVYDVILMKSDCSTVSVRARL